MKQNGNLYKLMLLLSCKNYSGTTHRVRQVRRPPYQNFSKVSSVHRRIGVKREKYFFVY